MTNGKSVGRLVSTNHWDAKSVVNSLTLRVTAHTIDPFDTKHPVLEIELVFLDVISTVVSSQHKPVYWLTGGVVSAEKGRREIVNRNFLNLFWTGSKKIH